MSESGDRGRRGYDYRRRHGRARRGGPPIGVSRGYQGYNYSSSRREPRQDQGDSPILSRPTILVKPSSERTQIPAREITYDTDAVDSASSQNERPITLLRSKEETTTFTGPSSPVSADKTNYQILRPGTSQHEIVGSRMEAVPAMKEKLKLIDDLQQWCVMSAEQMLMEQADFLVIGVIGLHGTGKSSLVSFLTGSKPYDPQRLFLFPPEDKEDIMMGRHTTVGVDMCVTPERIILLDTQPVLSTSVLDHVLHSEAKYTVEYASPENGVELQSLQMVAFLMSVCHVILVVEDWFTDLNLLNFINTAEMLKPVVSTPLNTDSTSTSHSESVDYCPHIVFIQNKAPAEYFTIDSYKSMENVLTKFFSSSNLKHSGSVNLAKSECIPGLTRNNVDGDLNLFILPTFERESKEPASILKELPVYKGHPSFESLFTILRNQLLAVPRLPLSHSTLTEKNWFNYAARMWDQVKKSQIISEYNRFLP